MLDKNEMQVLLNKYKLFPVTYADEEQVQKNVVSNLNYLMVKNKPSGKHQKASMSQKDLADLLGIGAPQLTRILHGEQTPTIFPLLANVKSVFGYSIDEFLYTDIEMVERMREGTHDDLPVASYMKFLGLYQLYYFDTASFKGRERSSNEKAIKSGVMFVEKDAKTDKYRVMAIFNMTKDRADDFYRNVLKGGTGNPAVCREKMIAASGANHIYFGELDLSSKHVYINLRFEDARDRVQMIFHRPESNSNQYIGGLGAMVSVSKGRNAAPCVQYIALANESLNVAAEELAVHLLMHYPNIKTYDAIDDLVDFTTDLYSNRSGTADRLSRLSEEQKKSLVRNYLDKIVNDTVEKNLFRTVIVSPVDDDEFYHYIKRVKENNHVEVI